MVNKLNLFIGYEYFSYIFEVTREDWSLYTSSNPRILSRALVQFTAAFYCFTV